MNTTTNTELSPAAASGFKDQLDASMTQVEQLLSATYTEHYLETQVNSMCMHVIAAGGKRIRPRLTLLAAHALPEFIEATDGNNINHVAAAIEILHTATLVHDDVIDRAPLRRGAPTLNELDGNHAAVLAGDYLFTRCFSLLQQPRNFDIFTEVSKTLSHLVVGELYQLEHEGDINLSLDIYYKTIYSKTGALFELAASAPTLLIKDALRFQESLKSYGRDLGIAFQIKDDILDYSADAAVLGKDAGTDLADQRITLPVLMALNHCDNDAEREQLITAIRAADLDSVKAAIIRTNALALCEQEAEQACNRAISALSPLPDSPARSALVALCHQAVSRCS